MQMKLQRNKLSGWSGVKNGFSTLHTSLLFQIFETANQNSQVLILNFSS